MKILLHCDFDEDSIVDNFGLSEYSYWFVHEAYRGVLEGIARTQVIRDLAEADQAWRESRLQGEDCVLLSFNPPHKTPVGLQCPTVPVFAWEYPDLPRAGDEPSWDNAPCFDWEGVFRQTPGTISLSAHSAEAVRRRLGPDYLVQAIPTPVWDRLASVRGHILGRRQGSSRELRLTGQVVDSRALGLNVDGHYDPEHRDGTPLEPNDEVLLPPNQAWNGDGWQPPVNTLPQLPSTEPQQPDEVEPVSAGWFIPPTLKIRTDLGRVVYTSVLTPADGRKNWHDLVTAFIWALRDAPDATLLLKVGGGEQIWHHQKLVEIMSRLSPFQCRILVVHGFLETDQYEGLIANTDFYVNASLCEGLCMPLMEYLSCGIPAIAPDHTAMADYIDAGNAYVVGSGDGAPMVWPFGDLQMVRTTRPRIDWQSLMQAFRDSYHLATQDADAYAAMSQRASESMRTYCGDDACRVRFQEYLALLAPRLSGGPSATTDAQPAHPSTSTIQPC